MHWLTTILIFLPIAGALLVWLLPLPARTAASTALLIALAEVGFWIETLVRFDFARGLQFEQRGNWFRDLHVSYHVGLYGFSLWLVGLAVLAGPAAIADGFWGRRDRPPAYYGLMLFLVGVWGGPGRLAATVKLVIYTLAGSLLMLAAIVAYGISQQSFDLTDGGTSGSTWIFLGFAAAFAVKAPLFPLHG